ncbi:hypothetical protein [Streptomyces hainanensis]|uniref:Uncharacterized protein n=1 Tax=Streptomyces hainanensis TaxID=402648 RepID=A0A4R4TCA9_9ACTN|nr:hypothetical protein [Streptomyces hainanensis]TDC72443.1 hypothetical protein E1283_21725 [Streptomyces hainanensis]
MTRLPAVRVNCYLYEMADRSWRDKPVAMPRRTIDQVAHRSGEHLRAHAALAVHALRAATSATGS